MNMKNEHLKLIDFVNESFECDLMKKDRFQNNANGRHAISFYMRRKLRMTYMQIGEVLDKNHATIMHSEKKHEDLYKWDKKYKTMYDIFISKVNGKDLPTICIPYKYELKRLAS